VTQNQPPIFDNSHHLWSSNSLHLTAAENYGLPA